MYTISAYSNMIRDEVRMRGFSEALRQSVKPGHTVLDIGTGTGIFALLACQFGARRVYAIEPSNAIHMAREMAQANGYANRIEFFQAVSTEVDLPERVDIIISDLRGQLPFLGKHIPAIADARRRFLAPGGRLIAQSDTLWAAMVDAPNLNQQHQVPWLENQYGLDMSAAHSYAVNTWFGAQVASEQLLTPPAWCTEIDYMKVDEPDLRVDLTWTVSRSGTVNGLYVWFDTKMTETVCLRNTPENASRCEVFGSGFFPLRQAVKVDAGDEVSVRLRADLADDRYIWRWNTRIVSPVHQGGETKADFQQCTLFAEPVSLQQLHRTATDFVPAPNTDGRIQQVLLGLMDGDRNIEEIAKIAADRFPERYGNWKSALADIGELSLQYSE